MYKCTFFEQKNVRFEPKMIRSSLTLITLLTISALFTKCSNDYKDKSKRPSPPAADTTLIQTAQVIIDYSSPAVKKRKLLDGLIPYGKIWRTGANEATNLITDKDLLVMGQLLPKGRYAYYTIASEDEWTIILNKDWDQWGAYNYEEGNDALRVKVLPYRTENFNERMRLYFEDEMLLFHWGNYQYGLELEEAP